MSEAEMVDSVMERMRAYINLSGSDSDAKILSREVDRLRAVLANEVKHHVAKIDELARFKNWQPSDPGTKEAMAVLDSSLCKACLQGPATSMTETRNHNEYLDAGKVVLIALRAAMVRLEEAESNVAKAIKDTAIAYDKLNAAEAKVEDAENLCIVEREGRKDAEAKVRELEAKLSLYTSWEPSDPGTKDAMEKITARLKAATPGPWLVAHEKILNSCKCVGTHGRSCSVAMYVEKIENAQMIAHAPADIAYLLTALTAAMVRLEEAEKVMRQIVSEAPGFAQDTARKFIGVEI